MTTSTSILQFMGEHPWFTLLFALLGYSILYGVFCALPQRVIRHLNIRKAGWPPAHLDADGNFSAKDETDEEKAE